MIQKRKDKIFLTIMLILFILLNYTIIAVGRNMTYNLEDNNCTHMSQQLEGMIEPLGIPVTLKTGGSSDGSRHMWIELWGILELDSVTLFPVINTGYNQHMVEYESFDEYEKRYT